ncbi:hypothetical protein HanHA300_Chr14g0516891 [Helianthus annuus]|nr:hypothetical protein HanHA300_Chr14g0516891 [Helianthus annuus]KAJ0485021.1 hypothetical protein HanHA89_Chr14g0563461 [Helianthus annuus]KAJ0655574.1 hypothetical protein HanLR1_Chr14g0525831 [Helianthus annuus]
MYLIYLLSRSKNLQLPKYVTVLSISDAKYAPWYASLYDYNAHAFQPKQSVNGRRVIAFVMALLDSSTTYRLLLLSKSKVRL